MKTLAQLWSQRVGKRRLGARQFSSSANGATQLFTFGDSAHGQTGHAKLKHQESPHPLSVGNGDHIVSIGSGEMHSFAITSAGHVYGFGSSQSNQLCCEEEFVPRPIKLPIEQKVIQATGGKYHSLFVTESGGLLSVGHGDFSQLGYMVEKQKQPRQIPALEGVKIRRVVSGAFHSFAFDSEGRVYGWGQGHYGQTGTGFVENTVEPKEIFSVDQSDRVVHISAGIFHSIALTEQGNVLVWGGGKEGQLGQSARSHLSVAPRSVALPIASTDRIVKVAAGATYNIAVSASGRFFSWGSNTYGQLGTGDTSIRLQPEEITWYQPISPLQNLVCGPFHIMARLANGQIFSWGQGTDFQLATGQRHTLNTPTLVSKYPEGFGDEWIETAAGWGHTLILTKSRTK